MLPTSKLTLTNRLILSTSPQTKMPLNVVCPYPLILPVGPSLETASFWQQESVAIAPKMAAARHPLNYGETPSLWQLVY